MVVSSCAIDLCWGLSGDALCSKRDVYVGYLGQNKLKHTEDLLAHTTRDYIIMRRHAQENEQVKVKHLPFLGCLLRVAYSNYGIFGFYLHVCFCSVLDLFVTTRTRKSGA